MRAARPISPEDAAALVRSGDWVDYGFGLSQPDAFDRALAARVRDLRGVKIRAALTQRPRAVLEADPHGEHVLWFNWHFSATDRRHHDAGRCNYIPMNFGEAPDYHRRLVEPVDVACVKTCPMDEHGFFNFGASASYQKALLERARVVVVETCPAMPYVHGAQESIHASEVDAVIEGGTEPLPELQNPPASAVDRAVAALIAAEIADGSCLQIGIGGMPTLPQNIMRNERVVSINNTTQIDLQGQAASESAGHRHVTGTGGQLQFVRGAYASAEGSRSCASPPRTRRADGARAASCRR